MHHITLVVSFFYYYYRHCHISQDKKSRVFILWVAVLFCRLSLYCLTISENKERGNESNQWLRSLCDMQLFGSDPKSAFPSLQQTHSNAARKRDTRLCALFSHSSAPPQPFSSYLSHRLSLLFLYFYSRSSLNRAEGQK